MDYTCRRTIDISGFDVIVSLGNRCMTASALRELGLYKESFPFDYVPSTPDLLLNYLQNPDDFYPKTGSVYNADWVWFGPFDFVGCRDEMIETFKRRFERLYAALEAKKRILFVYTSEGDLYNEMGNRWRDNYAALCRFRDYVKERWSAAFSIVAVHVNKTYVDCDTIVNYTISVPPQYLSLNGETRGPVTHNEYWRVLLELMREVFTAKSYAPRCSQGA